MGLTISAWLWTRYADPTAATCGSAGCDLVRASAYARVGPIPLPALGVLAFGAFAATQWVQRFARAAPALALAAIVAGASLLALQAWAIGAWCPWCVAADVCAIGSGLLVWAGRSSPPPTRWAAWLTSTVAAAVVLTIAVRTTPADGPTVREVDTPAQGPLTVVEFVDFECPFCRRQHAELNEILVAYGDRVRVQRRHLPLPMHPHAEDAARVACCAAEQDLEEAVADALMASDDLTLPGCIDCATMAGAEPGLLHKCLDSTRPDATLAVDRAEADRLGIRRLPTCIVDGHAYEGVQDGDTLRAAIDDALTRQGAQPSGGM